MNLACSQTFLFEIALVQERARLFQSMLNLFVPRRLFVRGGGIMR